MRFGFKDKYMTNLKSAWFNIFATIVIASLSHCTATSNTLTYDKKVSNASHLKILVLGNSITGAPSHLVNWQDCHGIAASSPQNDYMHFLFNLIQGELHYAPEMKAIDIGEFERNFPSFDLDILDTLRTYNADLILFRIGDNVNSVMALKQHFWDKFEELINFLNTDERKVIICTSSYYPNKSVDAVIRALCEKKCISFIDISYLYNDESTHAYSERTIEDPGISSHPGDKGMQEIADILWSDIKGRLHE
jgi:hypothetical protein